MPLLANRSISSMRDRASGMAGEEPMSSQPPRPDEASAAGHAGPDQGGGLERHAIGLIVCVCVALVIGEYAKRLPSAGSFYTYLTRTFGAKTGFVTGVMLFGAY